MVASTSQEGLFLGLVDGSLGHKLVVGVPSCYLPWLLSLLQFFGFTMVLGVEGLKWQDSRVWLKLVGGLPGCYQPWLLSHVFGFTIFLGVEG